MYRKCKVASNVELCKNIYEMVIESDEIASSAKPGQFLHIKTNNGRDPLLRRPISISRAYKEKGQVSLIYRIAGRGTQELAYFSQGQYIDIMGPLGNGFPVFPGKKCAVVGGGMGVAPLLELLNCLKDCDAYIGFKCEAFKTEEYGKACRKLFIATEDGSEGIRGFATDLIGDIKAYDIVYACGPRPMMKKVKELCGNAGVECYMSVEERMGCGIGACLVCACSIEAEDGSRRYKKVCADGPVFNAREVVFDD